jgi:hypothetical protein
VHFNWPQLHVEARGPHEGQVTVGDHVVIEANVRLGALAPEDVAVEIVYRYGEGEDAPSWDIPMDRVASAGHGVFQYRGEFTPQSSGQLRYGVRVLPVNTDLFNKHELGLVRWA